MASISPPVLQKRVLLRLHLSRQPRKLLTKRRFLMLFSARQSLSHTVGRPTSPGSARVAQRRRSSLASCNLVPKSFAAYSRKFFLKHSRVGALAGWAIPCETVLKNARQRLRFLIEVKLRALVKCEQIVELLPTFRVRSLRPIHNVREARHTSLQCRHKARQGRQRASGESCARSVAI
jgi:hypothetical protein